MQGLDNDLAAIARNEDILKMDLDNLMDPSDSQYPKAKKWRSQQFKEQLGLFIKQNYQRDDIKITNKFAKLFYTKQYLMGIQNSNSFSKAEKILLHPNLTVQDGYYLENVIYGVEKYKVWSQFGSLGMLMVGYYKNKRFNEMVKKNPYQGTAMIGVFPIVVMGLNYWLIGPRYIGWKVKRDGLDKKYGVR